MLVQQHVERVAALEIELGELNRRLGLHRNGDDFLVLLGQPGPHALVDEHFAGGARLVEARPVIEFRHFIETEGEIVPRADPLGAVDRAGLQRLEDLAAGQVDNRCTELAQHLAAKSGHAEFQALVVFDGFHFLAIPAAHLHTGAGAHERHYIESVAQFGPQLHAVAPQHPGRMLRRVKAERHRGKEVERGRFALPVVRNPVAHLRLAAGYGVE